MRTQLSMAVTAALASLGLALGAAAQGTPAASSNAPAPATAKAKPEKAAKAEKNGSLASADRKFMEKAAMGGLVEVQLGTLAKERGMSDEVKSFASRMVTDHGKANDELKSLAASKGVSLPAELDKKHRKTMDKLGKLSGPDFDRAYMKDMVKDHKEDVSEFRKEAKKAKDADLQKFAQSTLPTLEEHLAMAKKTDDVVQRSKRTGDRETGSKKP